MAPPKRSKAKSKQLKMIGEFSSNAKNVNLMEARLKEQYEAIRKTKREINKAKCKLTRRKNKLTSLQQTLNNADKSLASSSRLSVKTRFFISSKKAAQRKKQPTNKETPHMAKTVRRSETFNACLLIHGSNVESTAYGMINTLTSKYSAKDLSNHILTAKPAFVNELKHQTMLANERSYYKSNSNLLRSLNVYYSHCVMGKTKYLNIRKANKNKVHIPNYVTYQNLSKYIRDINIGVLRDVQEDFGKGLEDEDVVEGMYRPLVPYVQRIAEFYFTVYQKRTDSLKEYPNFSKKNENSFQFLISFGGDGAPGSGTAFLLAFLNIGQRLMSSRENFLVFGAFCKEDCEQVRRYILKTVSDFKYLENNLFEVKSGESVVNVEFKIAELPNDMKMLCFLAGELNNNAHYFSTFANVNKLDCSNITKNIGEGSKDWMTFSTAKRVAGGKKAQEKRKEEWFYSMPKFYCFYCFQIKKFFLITLYPQLKNFLKKSYSLFSLELYFFNNVTL